MIRWGIANRWYVIFEKKLTGGAVFALEQQQQL
jgi:hypothetical protein